MTTLSWLRSLVAGFFDSPHDEQADPCGDVESELDSLKAVAALAVAQAGRAELELREALEANAPEAMVRARTRRLQEERARAAGLVERYRQHQERAVADLERLGQARRIERLNAERERLRRFVADSAAARDGGALDELEDAARAESARLDALAALEEGRSPYDEAQAASEHEEVRQQARDLLAQDMTTTLWPGA